MIDTRSQLMDWVDEDREALVATLADFVRARSPNPPGVKPGTLCILLVFSYGAYPYKNGNANEIDDTMHLLKTHTLSAHDHLMGDSA